MEKKLDHVPPTPISKGKYVLQLYYKRRHRRSGEDIKGGNSTSTTTTHNSDNYSGNKIHNVEERVISADYNPRHRNSIDTAQLNVLSVLVLLVN